MDEMLAATAAAEDRHFWFRGLRRTAAVLLAQAGVVPGLSRIVDCGAGTGRNLEWLSELGPAVGIELTPLALGVGRRHGRRLVRGSVTALPVGSNTVDLTTMFDVLYCLDDEAEGEAVREMWRVLRPGGVALVNTAALDILRGSHSVVTHERRRYTPRSLRELLTSAGFEVERLTFTNCSIFPAALAVRGIEQLTGRAGTASTADLSVPAAPVNALFDLFLKAEARLVRLVDLPIGTSLMAVARKPR